MLRIYLLLKKYMVLIYHLLKKYMISITYLLKNLPVAAWGASTYGARPLFSPARGRRAHKEQIEAERTGDFYPASELSGEIKLLLLLCVSILFF